MLFPDGGEADSIRINGVNCEVAGVFGDRYAAQAFCEQMVARVAAEAGLAREPADRLDARVGRARAGEVRAVDEAVAVVVDAVAAALQRVLCAHGAELEDGRVGRA